MKISRRDVIGFLTAATMAASGSVALADGVLKVASYPANPPWEFKDADGNFQGFEVDIVKEVASRLGMTPQIEGMDFKALFVASASGRADLVISSLTITDERLKSQSFTQPIVAGALGFATRANENIHDLSDLKGRNVGSIATSFGENWLKERKDEIGYGDYKSYDTLSNMLTDLMNGRVDAVASDIVGLRYAMTQMQGLDVPIEVQTGEKFAMMMPKDSPLLQKVNDAISQMKEDGRMKAIYHHWFGVDPRPDSYTLTPMPVPTSAD